MPLIWKMAFVNKPNAQIMFTAPRHLCNRRPLRRLRTFHFYCTIVLPGISGIASSYKCFLLDQFGVIHDGQRVYPGAVRVLNELHKAGKKTIILSNSSRRASSTVRALQRKAIEPGLIDAVVTSGELAFSALPVFAAAHPTARVLHFNWGSTSRSAVSIVDHGLTCIAPPSRSLHGCNVPAAADVDVIVAHGTTGITLPSPRDAVLDVPWQVANNLLVEIASLNPHTPFFVANPDIVTVDGAELRPMPGALAKIFQDAGGDNIHRLGKPDPVAYKEALRLADVQPSDVLAVGDSLAHDILGAADAGIDSLYIAGGINAERFNIDTEEGLLDNAIKPFDTFSETTLTDIIAEEAPSLKQRRPTYVSSFFRW